MTYSGEHTESFTLTLLSNVLHEYKENFTSHFYTSYNKNPINLAGNDWKVGIAEFDCPISWYNLPQIPAKNRSFKIGRFQIYIAKSVIETSKDESVTNKYFLIKDKVVKNKWGINISEEKDGESDSNDEIGFIQYHEHDFKIDYGNYSINGLLEVLNEKISYFVKKIRKRRSEYYMLDAESKFLNDDHSSRITLMLAPGDILTCNKQFSELLKLNVKPNVEETTYEGENLNPQKSKKNPSLFVRKKGGDLYIFINKIIKFKSHDVPRRKNGNYYGDFPLSWYKKFNGAGVPDLGYFSSDIFIYSNIVGYNFVGSDQVQILRVIRGNGKYGDHFEKTFQDIHYHPVSHNNIDEIEVILKDDQGNLIQYEYGKVKIILSFKNMK